MDNMDVASSSGYELNNNLEFLRTPVKHFGKFDYKKLQTFVAAMGLPSNLKRKQLLAIIVAKKMGKDNMIPVILKEVTRQRNQRKKYVREVINRHKLSNTNRLFPPKLAPLPPQVISNKATPVINHKYIPQSSNLETSAKTTVTATQLNYQPCFGFGNSIQTTEYNPPINQDKYLEIQQGFQYRRETYTSKNYVEPVPERIAYNLGSTTSTANIQHPIITYEYYYDANITRKYYTLPTNTYTTTRGILHMAPATSTTPWYHQLLCTTTEHRSAYGTRYNMPIPMSYIHCTIPVSKSSPQLVQNVENSFQMQMPEQLVDMTLNECKNGNEDINLDAILDFVMGDDQASRGSNPNLELLTNAEEHAEPERATSSSDSDSDISNGIHEMNLLYYAQLANRALWPLKRYTFTYGKIRSYIFDCLTPLNSDTNTCFTRSLLGGPHPYETYSNFKPKACIYSAAFASQNTPQSNVPECCLLQPEYSLSYGIPRMYYKSRNYANEYNSSHALNNYFFQVNQQQEDMSRFAYASPQVHYNILLPNEKVVETRMKSASTAANYVDLKPRVQKPPEGSVLDVEATIQPLTIDEEMLAYNSLEDINNIDITIHDASRHIHQAEHESQCYNTKIPCPFLFTYCNWFESAPMMAKHIREMHSEKIVAKKSAEYYINFVQLEMLNDRGVKIIQEYNNRLCYISLCYHSGYIFITIQELCESIEQHGDKIKAILLIKHHSGVRSWTGFINSMIFPLSHLWKQEYALIIPIQYLKYFQSKHFRLQVDVGI